MFSSELEPLLVTNSGSMYHVFNCGTEIAKILGQEVFRDMAKSIRPDLQTNSGGSVPK